MAILLMFGGKRTLNSTCQRFVSTRDGSIPPFNCVFSDRPHGSGVRISVSSIHVLRKRPTAYEVAATGHGVNDPYAFTVSA